MAKWAYVMKIKILFFHFDLGGGGAERVLVNLVNNLNAEKYDITVQTIFDWGANRDLIAKHIHRKALFHRKPFRGMKYLMQSLSPGIWHRLLIKEHYDVEIAYLEGMPTRIISGCHDSKTKTFAWVHTCVNDSTSIMSSFRNLKEAQKAYSRFDQIAFISIMAKDAFMKKYPWDNVKCDVVYNTLDVDAIMKNSSLPINIKLDVDKTNLCSVGRLTEVKGFDRLITILKELSDEGFQQWHLYLLGNGECRSKLEDQTRQLFLSSQITFLGFDTNPYKYVSKMDLFVCSSHREGYSTAVTESVIVGTPVITTACSGMDEILGNEAGMIVENSDKGLKDGLRKILSDKSLIKLYKQKTIERSSVFSTANTIGDFERFIGEIDINKV